MREGAESGGTQSLQNPFVKHTWTDGCSIAHGTYNNTNGISSGCPPPMMVAREMTATKTPKHGALWCLAYRSNIRV